MAITYVDSDRMSADLLICPGCRSLSEGRIDLRTSERAGDEMVCECGLR